jgi:hypothetical protein
VLADIDGQLKKLEGKKFDLITLTIGGNDFGFGDVAVSLRPMANAVDRCI